MAQETVTTNAINPTMFSFRLLPASAAAAAKETRPRLGQLIVNKHHSFDTPGYLAPTSRGIVPHLSQDNLQSHTRIHGVFVALEDFVEKTNHNQIPVYNLPPSFSSIRQFLSLPDSLFTVLSPRRSNPILCPSSNTDTHLSILTSVGFRSLSWTDYISSIGKLKPDIAISMVDLPNKDVIGKNRGPKMVSRTEGWFADLLKAERKSSSEGKGRTPIFAPIVPLQMEEQRLYVEYLVENKGEISGLAIYNFGAFRDALSYTLKSSSEESRAVQSEEVGDEDEDEGEDADSFYSPGLPRALLDLPRLSLDPPSSPHKLLEQISSGVDIFNLNFISEATDAGIALDFYFPLEENTTFDNGLGERRPLGKDMWKTEFATDLSPLSDGTNHPQGTKCTCYSCRRHHRAYVQHLLMAKEMTAWVLLQIHNYMILDNFFSAVRQSIASGRFHKDKELFSAIYAEDLPQKTGQGPRVRGYQFKSESGAKKKNPRGFEPQLAGGVFGGVDKEQQFEDADAPPDADAKELEESGFAERV